MPAIDRGLDRLTFLPEALREALRRRLRELGGLALILVATLLALALATWSVQDPSLSHATNAPIRNVLGVSGAIVADLLIQLLGVAALVLVLPIAIWGWRLATHRPLQRERIRLLFCVLAVLLATACTAALPRSPAWPLPVGLGGVIGDWMLRFPSLLAGGTLSGLTRAVVAIMAGAGTLACFAIAAGLGWRAPERHVDDAADDDGERGSISLGWITHGFLSLKARLARALKRRPQSRAPARREAAAGQNRAEPRFEESARATLQPRIEAEEDDEDEDEAAPRGATQAESAAARTAQDDRRLCAAGARTPGSAESGRSDGAEQRRAAGECRRARGRARRLRRARRDHQCPAGSGGHAL